MPITSEVIKSWAEGKVAPQAAKERAKNPEAEGPPPEEAPGGEQNALWAGSSSEGPSTPEEAVELVNWLRENEPDLWAGYEALGAALVEDEPEEIEAAKSAILSAPQSLAPEYPPVDEEQVDRAAAAIDQSLLEAGDPPPDSEDWTLAVGIGIAMSRAALQDGGEEVEDVELPPEAPPPAPEAM